MKSKLLLLVGLVALCSVTSAAEPVSSTALVRIQAEVSTGDVTAFFEKSVTVEGVTYKQPWESVSWNASDKTVKVGEATMTYSQVMQFVAAIAQQEYAAKLTPPAPDPLAWWRYIDTRPVPYVAFSRSVTAAP
jgi:hypothetical protein